jgi:hypothetical protein
LVACLRRQGDHVVDGVRGELKQSNVCSLCGGGFDGTGQLVNGVLHYRRTGVLGRLWPAGLYLECGSVGALAEELARRNIVSKVKTFAGGRAKGGGPYSVGALAHFLKNRFYIGEVFYRGEAHAGEHASIIDRPTFEAVQAKLAENARARRVRVENAPPS